MLRICLASTTSFVQNSEMSLGRGRTTPLSLSQIC
jgi:hypothetical protein